MMTSLCDFKIVCISCSVVALSILFAFYGIRVQYHAPGFIRLLIRWPENRIKNVTVPHKSPFEDAIRPLYMSIPEDLDRSYSLHYDFYRKSCPAAERIIAKAIREIYNVRPSVAPELIRLLFHDCFIEGCDASVLLDKDETFTSEKEAIPNQSLKGFDVIDAIKMDLENVCPGIVSCADVLVLSARESVLVAGGPYYPLYTGRKDSVVAFKDIAERELPSPRSGLSAILSDFASRGFNERETVSLLGSHSIGNIHCTFVEDRLYNFSGTGKPDPTLNPGFLQELKSKCPFSSSALSPSLSPSASPVASPGLAPSLHSSPISDYSKKFHKISQGKKDGLIDLSFNNEGGDENFGARFYRRLLQNKAVLFSDQQLMGREETAIWVRAYASAPFLFQRDFALAMMKLSNYHVLSGPLGQVRTNCSKLKTNS